MSLFVIVTENGGCCKITKREAIITQLVNRSASRFCAIKILPDMVRDREARPSRRLPRSPPPARLLESGKVIIENLTREQYDTALRQGFVTFTARCFHNLKGKPSWLRSC